jgi:AI-2E family transporter
VSVVWGAATDSSHVDRMGFNGATWLPGRRRADVLTAPSNAVTANGSSPNSHDPPPANAAPPAPAPARPVTETPTIRLAAPSVRGVVRVVAILVVSGILLYLLWRVRAVVQLVGISLFLALALMPVVDALDNRIRLPRGLLILLVYVLLIAAVAAIGYVVVPSLVKEVEQLSHDAPRYAAELRHNSTFRHYDNRHHVTRTLVRAATGVWRGDDELRTPVGCPSC